HPYWTVEHAEASYGLGLAVQTIGDRTIVGHGGGFPGHSTNTLIDPVDRLVVVIMLNTHGPRATAGALATSVVKILQFALASQPATHLSQPRERFVGRFMSIWGMTDIAAFGNRLVALSPDEDDPTRFVTELE